MSMKIYVKHLDGRIVSHQVKTHYEVDCVLETLLGAEHGLSFNGERLLPGLSLAALGVTAGCVLSVLPAPPPEMQIFVRTEKTFTLTVSPNETLGKLKDMIEEHDGMRRQFQRVHFAGIHLMDDDRTLAEYGIGPDRTLQCYSLALRSESFAPDPDVRRLHKPRFGPGNAPS